MRALAGLADFRGEASLGTWLCGIALNRWRELQRRSGREVQLELVVGTAREAGPGVDHEPDAFLRAALDRALARLPDGYREVLLLHDVEGYTHEQIAQHFGIAVGTSKSQLHRARRALRTALAGKGVLEHER